MMGVKGSAAAAVEAEVEERLPEGTAAEDVVGTDMMATACYFRS